MTESAGTTVEDCAAQVGSIFERIFTQLDTWRAAIATDPAATTPIAPTPAATPARTTPARLDTLVHSLVVPALSSSDPLLIGAGFIAAPDYVHGREVHFSWWLGPLESNPLLGNTSEPTRLDLSTRGYADYLRDFRVLEWYSIPETTRHAHITGPYVDYLCMCDYILTLTMPAEIDGTMIGVVGADVYVKRLERELLPLFLALDAPIALLNQIGRVIVSTDPTLAVGGIVPDPKHPGGAFTLHTCPGTPFSLAVQSRTSISAP